MGGCYRTGSQAGSEICTAAEGGKCTACKTDSGLFKNLAATPDAGRECLLCWDTTGANGYKGVDKCTLCEQPNREGAATCTECTVGTYKSLNTNECKVCNNACTTCSGKGANACTLCAGGKYLDRNSCVTKGSCGMDKYEDNASMACIACSTIDGCTKCKLEATGRPECTVCNLDKIPRTGLDGTSTCITKGYEQCQGADKELFMKEDQLACLLCGDTKETGNDKSVANCKTCTKSANDSPPTCTACKEGYIIKDPGNSATCEACGANCATCSQAILDTKCTKCKEGFFLAEAGEGKCISCENGNDGGYSGIAGCLSCKAPTTPGPASCDRCKIGYILKRTTCVKVCEDEKACGGIAGACDATVIDEKGVEHHYCSYCGTDSEAPIDGKCSSAKGSNACNNGVCTQCTAGFFLYMGGCYSTANPPGNLMCKTADGGVCTEAASDKYFAVPGAAKTGQSVLACGNPLGTAVGEKTYVGVEGCSQCTAPAQLEASGMAAATCTACGEGRKPSKSGTGCAVCSDANCRHCRVDGVCEECSSGFSLEGGKCVSTSGPNLSTGAIAGISVAAVLVVGGLVGFLCWWFICRGKA